MLYSVGSWNWDFDYPAFRVHSQTITLSNNLRTTLASSHSRPLLQIKVAQRCNRSRYFLRRYSLPERARPSHISNQVSVPVPPHGSYPEPNCDTCIRPAETESHVRRSTKANCLPPHMVAALLQVREVGSLFTKSE